MNTYKKVVLLEVEVQAFSENDADEVIEDLFGKGEMEDFDVVVRSMEIVR